MGNTLEETVSFSMYQGEENQAAPSAFATASLDDCGLDPQTLKVFCAGKVGTGSEGGSEGGAGDQSDNNIVRDLVFGDNGYLVNSLNHRQKIAMLCTYICILSYYLLRGTMCVRGST